MYAVSMLLSHYFSHSREVCSKDKIAGTTLRMMIIIFIVIALELTVHASSSLMPADESRLERMNQHDRFVKKIAPLPWTIHEVVIAVRQRNLVRFQLHCIYTCNCITYIDSNATCSSSKGVLESELMKRSSPNTSTYMKWMTYEQVGNITSNPDGAAKIIEYLRKAHVNVTKISPHQYYIHASAPVSTWETLLSAKFFIYDDRSNDNRSSNSRSLIRSHR